MIAKNRECSPPPRSWWPKAEGPGRIALRKKLLRESVDVINVVFKEKESEKEESCLLGISLPLRKKLIKTKRKKLCFRCFCFLCVYKSAEYTAWQLLCIAWPNLRWLSSFCLLRHVIIFIQLFEQSHNHQTKPQALSPSHNLFFNKTKLNLQVHSR